MAGWITITLVVLAGLATTAVLVEAVRRRILWRMAARNAVRRPRQTATVIAGLMIGTAIISAAIVAGQSAGHAIRGAVYEALGEVDETVRLDAFNFFPESVLDDFRADGDVTAFFDGISANAIWDGAATNPVTDLFEPQVAAVGFDPAADAAFRPFHLTDGTTTDGSELRPGQAIVTKRLADAIEIEVGERIEFRFTPPMDPLVPDVFLLDGTVTGVGGLVALLGLDPLASEHTFEVEPGADALVTVIVWDPRIAATLPGQSVTVALEGPDGTVRHATQPLTVATPPVWLNVTDGPPAGTWTLRVSGVAAVALEYSGAAVALYPVYDPAELQKRLRDLQSQDLGPFEDILDEFDVFGEPRLMTLDVIAITDGGRGEQFDFHEAIFLHIRTAQEAWDRPGEINVIKFSNPGDMVEGRDRTDEAVQRLNATLDGIRAKYPHDGAVQKLSVHPVKDDFIQLADDSGQLMTGLLLFAGSLTVITGLLLIINIFTMLAEERRSELGMARAVGMTRRDLVRLFLFEGSLYAAVAAAIGALLGVALAAALIAILNAILTGVAGDFPRIGLRVTADALLASFAAGTLLTFVTIAVASRRASRLNIVRAIRRVDEPDRLGTMLQFNFGVGVAVVGAMVTVAGWAPSAFEYRFTLQVLGPLLIALGAALALKRFFARRRLYPMLSALLAAYYVTTYFLIQRYENVQEVNIVGPVRGVILTMCIVVIISYFEALPRAIGRLIGRTRRMRPVALPAVSYPQHKRFRTGMTLAMFSIVILSISFFSIFGGLFDVPPETQTGGFDVEATTTLDVEDLGEHDRGLVPAGTVVQVVGLTDFFTRDVTLITVSGERTGQFNANPGHHVFGMDEAFMAAQQFRLLWRLDDYATDEDAYRAVLERDDAVIVAYPYSTNEQNQDLSHQVGESVQLHLGDDARHFTIVGIQEQYHFPGIFLSKEQVDSLFPTTARTLYLYRLAAGTDAVETARLLEQNYRDVGMNAEASREKVLEEQEAFRQILAAMKLFLGLGLIVGVLSLGIVTARSVIERRQEIGVLRALGYTATMIRRIFFIEVTLVVFLGAIIGVVCSIVVSFGLWFTIIRELQYPYVIPWGEIAILLAVAYVVALAATVAPIRRASRVAPAEALRYID